MKFIEENVGVISRWDEEKIIQDVLENNIYVIAKTPMAKTITQRTLAGYKNWKTNISYIPDIVKEIKDDIDKTVEKVQKSFGGDKMKFDVVVGNPPYQESNESSNRDESIYPYFYDLAEKIADKYCLISPVRFLFNIGATSSEWNAKMLSDQHLKVVYYNQKSSEVFPNTDIKGGIVVLYRDENKNFGAVETFTSYDELKSILKKVEKQNFIPLSKLIYGNSSYKLTDKVYEDFPEFENRVSENEKKSVGSNIFNRFAEIFTDQKVSEETVQIYGRQNRERIYKFIKSEYIKDGGNLKGYKVFVPGASGSGAFGESLSTPVIGYPSVGHTQTFISIGNFKTVFEAQSLLKYLKGKFARAMLGIKKTTQNNKTKETWSKVPLQDFTENSDIDWTQSIADIDQQLYKKYNLDEHEIAFIEEKVRAME